MNNLPQNELFSAYLDGELTAAEQADIERLLASDPAARQLMDELRALSATLQALPQQKLGEDLSRQVLLAAERRKLAESNRDEIEMLPMPSERSIYQRFLNRRALAWAGLAVAIAVMISMTERRQGGGPKGDGVREVAVARSVSEKAARKSGPPPSIQAAHDHDERSMEETEAVKTLDDRKSDKSDVAAEFAPRSGLQEPAAAPAAAAPPLPAAAMPAAAPRGEAKEHSRRAKDGGFAGKAGKAEQMFHADKKKGADEAPAAMQPKRSMSKAAAKPAASAPRQDGWQNAKAANVAADNIQGVLVVRCEITPEAAKRREFDKLLTANGIQPSQRRNQMQQALNAPALALEESKQQAGEKKPETSPAGGEEEIVDIEATAAQIEATVAGLEALPDHFLSVSIAAGADELSLKSDNLARNQSRFGGRERDSQSKGEMNAAGATVQQAQQPMVAQQPAMTQNRQDRASQQVENRRNLQNQLQMQQMNRPASQQRAMFVLRVVEGQRPPVAAAKARNNAEADAAKQPAAAPPADMPAKR